MERNLESAAQVAPFVVWMVLMLALPSAPWAYAVRTLATIAALAWGWKVSGWSVRLRGREVAWGVAMGLFVLALWVWPEKQFGWYRAYCMTGYTANASVDGSAWHWKAMRLLGSAFVISVAEELFFRKWLLRTAGFGWMVVLFAVEHNRWLVAAITGALYGWLALRKGFASAVVAHTVTNLALGVYVLVFNDWAFW